MYQQNAMLNKNVLSFRLLTITNYYKLFAYAASHLLAHVKPLCNAVCPRYTTLKLDTRVCALHCDLPVFPHTNGVSKLRVQSRLHITFSPRPSIT